MAKTRFTSPATAASVFAPFLAASLLSACSLTQSGANYVRDCVLPEDQTGTLLGKWRVRPVPVAFHTSFSDNERDAMAAAIQTWNSFYEDTQGGPIFDIGSSSKPYVSTSARPAAICAKTLLPDKEFKGAVVVYKQTTWPSSYPARAIAITSTCPRPTAPLKSFYSAMIEVNYQSFFRSGTKVPDLETIVLHELGHLAGLNHSCEGSPIGKGVPNCSSANLDPSYSSAVMFPVFGFTSSGYGEQKRSLGENDQGRGNCLYSGDLEKGE